MMNQFIKTQKTILQLLICIFLAFILGQSLSVGIISFFYTVSNTFINLLIFILPFIIFNFIFNALLNRAKGSLSLIVLIFAGVTISNCAALMISYFFSVSALPFLSFSSSIGFLDSLQSEIQPLFSLEFPRWIGTENALALGLSLGIGFSYLGEKSQIKKNIESAAKQLNWAVSFFLNKIFIPLLPLYLFGFCLKLSYDQSLVLLFKQFGKIFLLSFSLVGSYLFFLYWIGSNCNLKETFKNIGEMLPAGVMGFSTMSSAVTMPVTIACVEKLTKDRSFTQLIIPSTSNIHMLGDDLNLVVISMALLSFFSLPWPGLMELIPFAFAFSLAKLSCVGVPGASVLVVLPVLQNYLGFSPEMITLLTTIYILQDSFGTAANVMGNGAFALCIHRLFRQPEKSLEGELI